MKRFPIIIILAFFFSVAQANKAEILVKEDAQIEKITEADVQLMVERVQEINAMDLNELSSTERYALKYELNQIKSKVNAFMANGGIYIGGGTLLLIIILLIILL